MYRLAGGIRIRTPRARNCTEIGIDVSLSGMFEFFFINREGCYNADRNLALGDPLSAPDHQPEQYKLPRAQHRKGLSAGIGSATVSAYQVDGLILHPTPLLINQHLSCHWCLNQVSDDFKSAYPQDPATLLFQSEWPTTP